MGVPLLDEMNRYHAVLQRFPSRIQIALPGQEGTGSRALTGSDGAPQK
jgi:hypothetical protein